MFLLQIFSTLRINEQSSEYDSKVFIEKCFFYMKCYQKSTQNIALKGKDISINKVPDELKPYVAHSQKGFQRQEKDVSDKIVWIDIAINTCQADFSQNT